MSDGIQEAESRLCSSLAAYPGSRYQTSLRLGFLICEMGINKSYLTGWPKMLSLTHTYLTFLHFKPTGSHKP